jgi:hypothetical protein
MPLELGMKNSKNILPRISDWPWGEIVGDVVQDIFVGAKKLTEFRVYLSVRETAWKRPSGHRRRRTAGTTLREVRLLGENYLYLNKIPAQPITALASP